MDAGAGLFRPRRVAPWQPDAWLGAAALFLVLGGVSAGMAATDPERVDPVARRLPHAKSPLPRTPKTGIATVYRLDGRTTASGELFNRNALTAAHRSLPFGTLVRVTNLHNQRDVVVRINDRGPNVRNRLIDLTPRAAAEIGLHGIREVRLDVLSAAGTPGNLDDLPSEVK
jgi:rare lipoprotein A